MLSSQVSTRPCLVKTALFCNVDDFCGWFEPCWQKQLLSDGLQHRQRNRSLCLSETLTILIAFYSSAYRNFKAFYTQMVCVHWQQAFPGLVSYHRFALLDALKESCRYLPTCVTAAADVQASVLLTRPASRFATTDALLDIVCSKAWLPVAKPQWTGFLDSSYIWLLMSTRELLNVMLTPGNTDDRKPVPQLLAQVFGKI